MNVRIKRNFKLVLEYDGAGYHGWQRQRGVLTVQEVLESRLSVMVGQPVTVRASGRTDAGVHALGQVVSFNAATRLQPEDFLRGLNALLPPDIVVLQAEEMPHAFHARYSATGKLYEYHILNRPVPSALERRRSWHVKEPLNDEVIETCLKIACGVHDFAAFMAAGSPVKSTVRELKGARHRRPDHDHLVFSFEADGFLRHMVRNLVGTLVEAGKGKRTAEEFKAVLDGRDRRKAGVTAPAHGLYLVRVFYDDRQPRKMHGGDNQ